MKTLLPFKIKLARQRRHLSMSELVAKMGEAAVTTTSISKFERGVMKPAEKTLQAIADACGVDVSFFYSPGLNISCLSFRYVKDIASKLAKQVEAQVLMAIEESFAKEDAAGTLVPYVNPLASFLVSDYDDAEDAATTLRKHLNIGTQPLFSVYELLQEMGIMVIEIPIPSKELLGTSAMINGTHPVVVINSTANTTSERKRFTALHELAHLMLQIEPISEEEFRMHNADKAATPPNSERLCHRFANAMLIQASSIKRRLGVKRNALALTELISIRNMYGISIAAIVHRAYYLSIIPRTVYDHWYNDIIKPNYMEIGWGEYPIMEKADRYELLEERIEMESGDAVIMANST